MDLEPIFCSQCGCRLGWNDSNSGNCDSILLCDVCKQEEENRYCVKCGKTSDLIDEEDLCYTCAEERGRV